LGANPRVGTSSVRRTAQLRSVFPHATFVPIRGNVDTRLRKLDAGECDVLVLAAAGVKRLGLEQRLSALIPVDVCLPAPGQGIVAVEIAERADPRVRAAVKRIADAERAVVRALGGGCQMPLGALTVIDGQAITVHGLVASLDGQTVLRATARGHRGGAAATGEKLAAQLIARGATEFLK
jgi:hydroxymethylbilane synthase